MRPEFCMNQSIERPVQNELLWELWRYLSWTERNATGFNKRDVYDLIGLQMSPITKVHLRTGKYKYLTVCQRLARYFDFKPEVLFPLGLYRTVIERKSYCYDPEVTYVELAEAKTMLSSSDPHLEAELAELRRFVQMTLQSFGRLEQQVIELRFGLNGQYEHTLDEVEQLLILSRDRIRGIQERVIRKLRCTPYINSFRAHMPSSDV